MRFKHHSDLEGRHALLSPSKYAWIRYDEDKMERFFMKHLASQRGTREHEWAQETIELGIRQAETKSTLNMYVNDCIGWRMTPEVPLFFSNDCFGRCDAIGFRDDILRISDYKSGVNLTKMDQLMIYAALACLEYQLDPHDIKIELRIYQSNDVRLYEPDAEDVVFNMRQIIAAGKVIDRVRREVMS